MERESRTWNQEEAVPIELPAPARQRSMALRYGDQVCRKCMWCDLKGGVGERNQHRNLMLKGERLSRQPRMAWCLEAM